MGTRDSSIGLFHYQHGKNCTESRLKEAVALKYIIHESIYKIIQINDINFEIASVKQISM